MTPFVCAGAGFLLAVLWFDLMFDVQVQRPGDWHGPDEVLASISAYYRRVTTAARPMNRLVAFAMLATIASLIVQIARADRPRWVGWVSLALAAGPILLAGSLGGATTPGTVTTFADAVGADPNVAFVVPPRISPAGDTSRASSPTLCRMALRSTSAQAGRQGFDSVNDPEVSESSRKAGCG